MQPMINTGPSLGSEFHLNEALLTYFSVIAILLGVLAVAVTVIVVGTYGPTGPLRVLSTLRMAFVDWVFISPGRIWAISLLTIKDAVRRKALLVGVVFAVLLLFAGWFVAKPAEDPEHQVKVYVSFVMFCISVLTLVMALLLSTPAIPSDIRLRSIHTVVTKPVRRQEIVLGRILGMTLVSWFLLLVMASIGYIWVLQLLRSAPSGSLVARVPVYGKISFLDRQGLEASYGVNTGDEWMFRSYIEGATKSRMMWLFSNVDLSRVDAQDHLRIEAKFQVFRTYKGNLERGIGCQLIGVNPKTKRQAVLSIITDRDPATGKVKDVQNSFEVRENHENTLQISRVLTDSQGQEIDLFKDLFADGALQVDVICLNSQMFIGAAGPDLFIRMPDKPFLVTYAKGVLATGMGVLMVVIISVSISCVAKTPIAMATGIVVMTVGYFARGFLDTIVDGKSRGGGILESIYRIVKHLNPDVALPENWAISAMKIFDSSGVAFLRAMRYVFPDLKYYNMTPYVANGFDVPWTQPTPPFDGALLPTLLITLGYALPWILFAYFGLRLRELEAK